MIASFIRAKSRQGSDKPQRLRHVIVNCLHSAGNMPFLHHAVFRKAIAEQLQRVPFKEEYLCRISSAKQPERGKLLREQCFYILRAIIILQCPSPSFMPCHRNSVFAYSPACASAPLSTEEQKLLTASSVSVRKRQISSCSSGAYQLSSPVIQA